MFDFDALDGAPGSDSGGDGTPTDEEAAAIVAVSVRGLDGVELVLDLPPGASAVDVKRRLEACRDIPLGEQRLLAAGGALLADSDPLLPAPPDPGGFASGVSVELQLVRVPPHTALYVVGSGGNRRSEPPSASAERFDVGAGGWEPLPPMAGRREACAVAACGGRLYVVGGCEVVGMGEARALSSVERFDPLAGRWETLSAMKEPRKRCSAEVLGDELFVVGGYNYQDRSLHTSERYDPAVDRWTPLPPMAQPHDGCATAVLGGALYVVGGRNRGAWEELAPMSRPRRSCVGAALGGSLYVLGGCSTSGTALAAAECFRPQAGRWEAVPPMREPREGGAAATVAGLLYVAGGYMGGRVTDSVESFDPATSSWVPLEPMRRARGKLTAIAF